MTAKLVALQLIEVGLQRDLVSQVSHQKATRLRSPRLQSPEARPDDRRQSAEVILRSAMTHEPGRHQCGGRGQERGEVAEEWQRVVHHQRGNAGKQSGEVFTWAAGEVRIWSKAKVVVERKNNRAAKCFFFFVWLHWIKLFFYDESPKQLGLYLSERKRKFRLSRKNKSGLRIFPCWRFFSPALIRLNVERKIVKLIHFFRYSIIRSQSLSNTTNILGNVATVVYLVISR